MKKNKILIAMIVTIVVIIVIVFAMILVLRNNEDTDENIANTNISSTSNITNNITDDNNTNPDTSTNIDEDDNYIPNSNGISIINNENEFISDLDKPTNNTEKNYIELTEENYNKYVLDTADQTFIIQDAINNGNGSFTIRGRVYKYIEIPNTITQDQYQALLNGKALNILGERVVKSSNDAEAHEAGYDMELVIQSQKYNLPMVYYVKRNDDGSGRIYKGSEAELAEGTDIYMQITLSANLPCIYNDDKMTLMDRYTENYHIKDVDKTRLILDNDKFVFKNGQCVEIEYAYN